jgi:aldehyde reductase
MSMPQVGFGTFRSEPGVVGAAVKEAIRVGYRHIDCAAIYGNEKEVGEAIKEVIDSGLVKREELFIVSKLWNTDHDHVKEACEATIRDLQCEYLDLYLVHFPLAFKHTGVGSPGCELDEDGIVKLPAVSLQETYGEMEKLVDEGLIRSIGVSNYEYLTMADCLVYARKHKPVTNQIEAHPYFQRAWTVKFLQKHDVAVTAHTPLGGGAANAKDYGAASPLADPIIGRIAEAHGKTPAQVCLRWALQRGCVVIPKSTKPERIAANFAIFDFELSGEEMEALAGVDREQRSNKSGRAWGIEFSA